jgi:IS4 transposase
MLRFMRSLMVIIRLIVSRRDEQVKFRLFVYSKEKVRRKKKRFVYFARATNLEIPKREVLDLYNKVRGPIETSYGILRLFFHLLVLLSLFSAR